LVGCQLQQARALSKDGCRCGSGQGTPEFYEAFPEALYDLTERLKDNEPHLQGILQKCEGEYSLTAVGARDKVLAINLQAGGDRYKSSLLNGIDQDRSHREKGGPGYHAR
jgi:hypothetical protein